MDPNNQQPWGRAWWGDENPQAIAQSWAAQPTQGQRAQKELAAQQQLWQGLQNSQQQLWQTGERTGQQGYGATQAELNRLQQAALQASQQGWQTGERTGQNQFQTDTRLGTSGGSVGVTPAKDPWGGNSQGYYTDYGPYKVWNEGTTSSSANQNPNTMGTQAFQSYMQQQQLQSQADIADQQRLWQLFMSMFGGG